jgi:hypothetical protein
MLSRRWGATKPPYGASLRVDPTDPAARGLLYCTLANTRNLVMDLVGTLHLPYQATTTLGMTRAGAGMSTTTGGEGAKAVIPAYLRLSTLTLIWRGVVLGAGDSAVLAGCWFSAIETAPYLCWAITRVTGTSNIRAEWNDGSYNSSLNYNVTRYGQVDEYALTLSPASVGGNGLVLYANGVQLGTSVVGNPPSFTTDSEFGIGYYSNQNRNANCITDGVWVYNRVLSPEEIAQHYRAPYSMLQSRRIPSVYRRALALTGRPGVFDPDLVRQAWW